MSTQQLSSRVGIEKIRAYPCSMTLDLSDLAEARGQDRDYPPKTLLTRQRSVNPCWEDPVTMAVNAAKPMLTPEDLASIELLIVGTESSADWGKPISTFVHRHLGIQPNCRNFETKHACYGGTAAFMMAAHWVASGAAPGAKALVIAADQGRMHLGEPFEYVLGAGAVALLVSAQPDVLELELTRHGYWTSEVGDTFRPTSMHEAGNTDNSVYCYLEAVQGAYDHFVRKSGPIDFATYFKHNLYHVPFCAMAYRAHRTLLRSQARVSRADAEADFERKVKPALRYNTLVGGTYTGSTFYSLCGLVDSVPDLAAGDRIGIFAYGSGSCAEFYETKLGPKAKQVVAQMHMQEALDARYRLSVAEYEEVERQRTGYTDQPTYEIPLDRHAELYRRHYAGQGKLVFRKMDGFFRTYDFS